MLYDVCYLLLFFVIFFADVYMFLYTFNRCLHISYVFVYDLLLFFVVVSYGWKTSAMGSRGAYGGQYWDFFLGNVLRQPRVGNIVSIFVSVKQSINKKSFPGCQLFIVGTVSKKKNSPTPTKKLT